jgi:hypothetical protein
MRLSVSGLGVFLLALLLEHLLLKVLLFREEVNLIFREEVNLNLVYIHASEKTCHEDGSWIVL